MPTMTKQKPRSSPSNDCDCSSAATLALLDAAELQRDDLMLLISEQEKRIHSLRWNLIEIAFGVRPGSLVRCGNNVFRINDHFQFFSRDIGGDKPWLHGFRRKKDGSFENSPRTLYRDWDKID